MTTVIFVHGISVREPKSSETFKQIKKELEHRLPDIKVVRCSWGDALGAKLNADGASIPYYDSTRNVDEISEIDDNIIRWMQLYQDSLYELRLLSLKKSEDSEFILNQEPLEALLDRNVKDFVPSDELQTKLQEGGIADIFAQAHQTILESTPYQEALSTITDTLTEHRDAIARAIIAEAISICERKDKFAPIVTDSTLRDDVVESLSNEIYYAEAGLGDWLKEQIMKLKNPSLSVITYGLKRGRGLISDFTNPMVGDILLYQGRGQKIRDLIESYIKEAEPPVVLLSHSLGGVACVDLLVEKQLSKVKLLVTVGSQAPYFYEINALQSLEFGQPLPGKFGWLNIFDSKDLLSFIGGNVFPDKVQDIPVDNKQPFPRSHSAYWTNKATWTAIVQRIKSL